MNVRIRRRRARISYPRVHVSEYQLSFESLWVTSAAVAAKALKSSAPPLQPTQANDNWNVRKAARRKLRDWSSGDLIDYIHIIGSYQGRVPEDDQVDLIVAREILQERQADDIAGRSFAIFSRSRFKTE